MSTKRGLLRCFAIVRQFGVRPPDGWDDEVAAPLWAARLPHDDVEVLSAFERHVHASRWWPTLGEVAAGLPPVERRRIAPASPCPTYDALPQDERARIGEVVVANKAIRWRDDDGIAAECERLAKAAV